MRKSKNKKEKIVKFLIYKSTKNKNRNMQKIRKSPKVDRMKVFFVNHKKNKYISEKSINQKT